jgi:hypothetical protein
MISFKVAYQQDQDVAELESDEQEKESGCDWGWRMKSCRLEVGEARWQSEAVGIQFVAEDNYEVEKVDYEADNLSEDTAVVDTGEVVLGIEGTEGKAEKEEGKSADRKVEDEGMGSPVEADAVLEGSNNHVAPTLIVKEKELRPS